MGSALRLTFCGVRGSTPSPGADFVRYGGHTSCVAVSREGEVPSLLIDAGTWLRRASSLCGEEPFRGSILLSHLHWDHTHGLPFFAAGVRPGHRVTVILPAPDGDPLAVLAKGFSPPHFPIDPTGLGPGWTFERVTEGPTRIEGWNVLAREIPHTGGQTFGFRVEENGSSFAYLSDHAPLNLGPGEEGYGCLHESALALADGVDVLIHDSQFLAREFPGVAYLGHASIEYACSLAEAARARKLVLFHYSPWRTDDEIASIVEELGPTKFDIVAAYEGLVLDV